MDIDFDLYRELHARALADADALVATVGDGDLGRPSPCADWDLRALLGHMIGQNLGFATAVRTGVAELDAYAPPAISATTLPDAWQESATRLREAFAATDPARTVRLVEVNPDVPFPVPVVLAMQLLDTAVHAWDVAASLGRRYVPADDISAAVAGIAQMVPAGPERRTTNAFGTALDRPDGDRWDATLAHLGRNPLAPIGANREGRAST